MADENVRIRGLAAFSCKRSEEVFEERKAPTVEDLEGVSKDLGNLFKTNIMGKGNFRGVWNSLPGENTRIHDFADTSTQSIFRELLGDEEKFEENATIVARKYYDVEMSRAAAIFIFTIQILPNYYVVIYSSEFLSGAVRFSRDRFIEDIKDVFLRGLKKGLIYPYEADGVPHYDKVKVYQKKGRYADYWWKAFDLREELSNKEVLLKSFKEREREKKEEIQFDEEYVREIVEEKGDAAASEITLVLDHITISTPFDQLYRKVIPVKKDGEEGFVVKDGKVFIKISKNKFREFKPEEGYKDYDEIE